MPPLNNSLGPNRQSTTLKNTDHTLASAHNDVAISTPAGVGIKIDDVNKSLWQYVKKRKLWELILFAPLVIVWEIFLVFLIVKYFQSTTNNSSNGGKGFGYLIAAPFVAFSSWLYKLKKQFEDAFLEEFALANGYSFNKNGNVDETYGTIFRLKGDQRVSDVVIGNYDNNTIRLFIYELTIDKGRYQQRFQDTVIELDLHGQLPNLLMVNKKSHYGQIDLAGTFGIKNTFKLEGDFNEYFTLYGQENNQIEALEVFSPDTMAIMEDESKHLTVEFSGDRVYIYSNGFITNTKDLTQAFALAKQLIEKIAPLASRLQHDAAIIQTPVNLSQTRKAHPFARKFGIVLTILLTITGLGLFVIALINAPRQTSNSRGTKQSSYILTTTDIANALKVSDEFIHDLGLENISSAEQLESPKLQNDTAQNQFLVNGNFKGIENSKLIDQRTGTDDQGNWVSVLYEDDSSDKPYFIKIELSQYGQDWRVWFFKSSYNKLNL
ncbi:MAG TPA: hypothetical protein VLF63_02310 [Patescibacteria group bacterium]|nr:hypothetical protein [Patescibacteria group bacterium]